MFFQMIPLILSIILTEKALKKNFDDYGRRSRTSNNNSKKNYLRKEKACEFIIFF